MVEDIRLSEQVNDIREKNYKLANEKLDRVAEKMKDILEEEFGGVYDECCIYSMYVRKGNDINSCAGAYMQGSTVVTQLDKTSFVSFVNNSNNAIEMSEL